MSNIYSVCIVCTLILHFIIAENSDLVMTIKNGKIVGSKNLTVEMQTLYYSFRGIPYAEPPIGDLRFSVPVPSKNWSGILDATKDGEICTQDLGSGSEDCLFINVYTTTLDVSSSLPVMVWIYGGFFLEGSSRYSEYGPDYFLDQDVVVVTFNYRLGVFGFLSTEDEAAPGNWGLKDQVLALNWVKENIQYFGGDLNKVTIFGESAGSASVSYLLQTNATRGLFRGAIMESGTSLNLWALCRIARETSFNLGRSLGITTGSSRTLIRKLRRVNYKTLQATSTALDIGETVLTNPRNGLIFAPVQEPVSKNSVVENKSHQKLVNGDIHSVPIIIGFNSQEGILFAEILDQVRSYLLTYDAFPKRLIPVDMNVNESDALAVALKIKKYYFGEELVTLSNNHLVQYITDDQFARPINEAVRLMSKYAKVYYYKFSYMGRLGRTSKADRPVLGVEHGEELPYLWRRSTNIQDPSKCDLLTRRRMVKLWTNFAKTLNPTPAKDPLLQSVLWRYATPEVQYYLDIDRNLTMKTDLSQYSIEWWKQLFHDYGNPPYDTY